MPALDGKMRPTDAATAELIFTALAELSTRQIAESVEAVGMPENAAAAKTGGGQGRAAWPSCYTG